MFSTNFTRVIIVPFFRNTKKRIYKKIDFLVIFSNKNSSTSKMINQFRLSDNRSSVSRPYSITGKNFISTEEYRVWFRFKEPQNVEEIKHSNVMDLNESDFTSKRRGWKDIIQAKVGDEFYMCVKDDGIFKGIVISSPSIEEACVDGKKNQCDGSAFHICWSVKWNKISDITDEWNRILKPKTISTAFRINV
jgi:hypothetical protein